jgi:hypothetical protein
MKLVQKIGQTTIAAFEQLAPLSLGKILVDMIA